MLLFELKNNDIVISEEIIETVHDLQALDASQVCHWNNYPSVIVS